MGKVSRLFCFMVVAQLFRQVLKKLFRNFLKTDKLPVLNYRLTGVQMAEMQTFLFEQGGDDFATLLKNLNADKADFFGFSIGMTVKLQISFLHPKIIDKIISGSALAKRNGAPEWFWDL